MQLAAWLRYKNPDTYLPVFMQKMNPENRTALWRTFCGSYTHNIRPTPVIDMVFPLTATLAEFEPDSPCVSYFTQRRREVRRGGYIVYRIYPIAWPVGERGHMIV